MAGSTKYFQDRLVLLLVSINTFLVVFSSLYILLRLGNRQSASFIIQYRGNLGLSAFKPGDSSTFIAFILFMIAVLVFHAILSRRVYHIRRHFAVAILGLGTLLILLAAIVSNALLSL